MLVDYSVLSDESRVWVYPSSRKFYPQEESMILQKLIAFSSVWKNEEEQISFVIKHHRFIVFLAEENVKISSEDINKQVGFILELQQELEIELLDKMNVCFKQGEYTQYKDVKTFKKLIQNRSVNSKTIVFDNLIQTKYDLENYWEIPITESWYNRFLK